MPRNREAWKGSTRKGRLPADWDRLRKAVLAACNHRCQWIEDGFRCPFPATDVDHIEAGDLHLIENLQGLCGKHHLIKTGREARARQLRFKSLARLPEEKQPGAIDGPPTPTQNRGF